MKDISTINIIQFSVSTICQVVAISLLPMTLGFTKPIPTAGCVILFSVAIMMLARIVASGAELGSLIPLSSASVPIAVIIAAVLFNNESASIPRLATLIGACALIGVATKL